MNFKNIYNKGYDFFSKIQAYIKKHKFVSWLVTIFCFLVFIYFFIPHVWLLNKKDVVLKVTRWTQQRGEFKEEVSPSYNSWVGIDNISKNVINALIVAEDGRFFEHCGLDFYEIKDSLKLNLTRKRYARGASTITQQVVKMVFLSNKKNLVRKLREILGALILERIVSKNTILEWYLNLVEFGDGAYGIKKGARYYFQTSPQLLTVDQAVHLVLVLPSPNSWNKGLKDRNLTEFGKKRFTQILYRMKMRGFISESRYRYELSIGNFGRSLQEVVNPDEDYLIEDDDIEDSLNSDESEWNNGSSEDSDSSKSSESKK